MVLLYDYDILFTHYTMWHLSTLTNPVNQNIIQYIIKFKKNRLNILKNVKISFY